VAHPVVIDAGGLRAIDKSAQGTHFRDYGTQAAEAQQQNSEADDTVDTVHGCLLQGCFFLFTFSFLMPGLSRNMF